MGLAEIALIASNSDGGHCRHAKSRIASEGKRERGWRDATTIILSSKGYVKPLVQAGRQLRPFSMAGTRVIRLNATSLNSLASMVLPDGSFGWVVDGGYKRLIKHDRSGGPVTLAFCLRDEKFFELHKATGCPVSAEALQCIAAIYAIKSRIRATSAEGRLAVRQPRRKPSLTRSSPGRWIA
jgi:hypothetical protein